MFSTKEERVANVLDQTTDTLFDGMQTWVSGHPNGTLGEFLAEAYHVTGVHRLKADA